MTNGEKVILSYYGIFYFIPLLAYLFFNNAVVSAFPGYKYTTPSFLSTFYIFSSVILFYKIRKYRLKKSIIIKRSPFIDICIVLYMKIRPIFLVASLIFSFYAYENNILSYRYDIGSMSDNLNAMLCASLNKLLMIDALCFIFLRSSKKRNFLDIVSSLALILLTNGIISAISSLFIFIMAIFPGLKQTTLGRITLNVKRILIYVIFLMVFPYILNLSINYGASIKHGMNYFSANSLSSASSYQANRVVGSLPALTGRISSHYISLLATTQSVFRNGYNYSDMFAVPFEGLIYRFGRILRLNTSNDKPFNTSIAQYNYRNITLDSSSNKEGSTPGVIAGFNYSLIFPLNIFFVSVYLVFIERLINTITYKYNKINFIIAFFLSRTFFYWCFASPFDYINFIDEGSITIILCFMIYSKIKSYSSQSYIEYNTRENIEDLRTV